MSEKKQQTAYPLRMPERLRDRLEASAAQGRRSLNAEILARLEASYEYIPQSSDISVDAGVAELDEISRKRMITAEMRSSKIQAVVALQVEMKRSGSAERIAALQAAHVAASAELDSLTKQEQELGERYYTLLAQVKMNSKAPIEG